MDSEETLTNRGHAAALFALATPIIAANCLTVAMTLVDFAMVGHLGKKELAATALSMTWFNLLNHPMTGAATALDTLFSQSFGGGRYERYGDWLRTGTMVLMAACVPMGVLLGLCEPFLRLLNQDAELSAMAGDFCVRLIPGLPPLYLFMVLTKYCQSQGILSPSVIIGVVANLFNVAFNYLLIYVYGYGLKGAPVATSVLRWFQFLLLALYLAVYRTKHSKTWPKRFILWDTARLWTDARAFAVLAFPGAYMLALEAWAFEVSSLMAGMMGSLVALDSHIILLNFCGFMFLSFPFALGIAGSIRVGHLLGAGLPSEARRATMVLLGMVTVGMIAIAVIFLLVQDHLGKVFTDETDVIKAIAALVPISVLFQLSDGVQAAIAGALRGMGRQKLVACLNFIGFWVVGTTLGAVLTFAVWEDESPVTRVAGLWWGLVTGITATSLIGVMYLSQTDWQAEADAAHQRSKVPAIQVQPGSDSEGSEHEMVLTTDERATLAKVTLPESVL